MDISEEIEKRILILDGAMGTMIQGFNLNEEDFRDGADAAPGVRLAGCNDLLSLTRPDVIRSIHKAYVDAGADIISTNSFNANSISLEEYGMQGRAADISRAAALLARSVADESAAKGRKVWVAGSMGPSNVALSLPDVAAARGVDFDLMREAYAVQAAALAEGGADVLLLETIFDTLNAKAAIAGIQDAFDIIGRRLPLMLSVTLTEQGRTLSGQTPEAFLASVAHAGAFSIGLNCGFGAEQMAPWLEKLGNAACYVSLHPNAGLPDEMGEYIETPSMMAATMAGFMGRGLINIAGGCCGTTPDHIRALTEVAGRYRPRRVPSVKRGVMVLSGTEVLGVSPSSGFLKVGERCNVAGSRKFLRLINEGETGEAVRIASAQAAGGAGMLDVNMDDAMLDAPSEMERFVTLLGQDGDVSALPLMVDSSDVEVIRRALRRIQGRPVVNSISLKEGEEKFLANAREIRRLGAAAVVMAFDEKGQATTFDRRVEICARAYRLLIDEAGFSGEDIVFDPNVLTIATGMPEHDRYALDFLDAVEWIKRNLPGAKVSGGISNLSFAFRGINKLREAMHAVFLDHAIARGMDMAIVNPSTGISASEVEPSLREAIEDVIFMRRHDATVRLLGIASDMKREADRLKAARQSAVKAPAAEATGNAVEDNASRVRELVIRGMYDGMEPLLEKALTEEGSAMAVVSKLLMGAMRVVGDDFASGRIFLPQVVRSASVMRRAIDWLTPKIENEVSRDNGEKGRPDGGRGKFVLATVKGDVHDIGKNIVGVILKCSGFDVIDLGVMVDEDKILKALKDTGARFLGLSGLITPSLSEMAKVASMLQRERLQDVTLCVGGATTSDLHTAVKIAPLFDGLTLHTRDAAQLPVVVSRIADSGESEGACNEIRKTQKRLREEYAIRKSMREKNTHAENIKTPAKAVTPMPAPAEKGIVELSMEIGDVGQMINWRAFLHTWRIPPSLTDDALKISGKQPQCECCGGLHEINRKDSGDSADRALEEAVRLIRDARNLLSSLKEKGALLKARVAVVDAHREGDDIVLCRDGVTTRIPTMRREAAPMMAMADFLAENDDHAGIFAVTSKDVLEKGKSLVIMDDYGKLMLQSMADRLVEAATERMHDIVHNRIWGLDTPRGIRPAIGYPSLPDQSLVFLLDDLIDYAKLGVTLTENGALSPSATTTGFIFASPQAVYFDLGDISEAMLSDYARRRGVPESRLRSLLPR